MKKLFIIASLMAGTGLLAQSTALPTNIQEKLYKEELAFVNTLDKNLTDTQLQNVYRAHLAKKFKEVEKKRGKAITSIHDERVFYEHLNTLLKLRKTFANFKHWLEGQIDGMNWVLVGEKPAKAEIN